jgi:hypothetical protein
LYRSLTVAAQSFNSLVTIPVYPIAEIAARSVARLPHHGAPAEPGAVYLYWPWQTPCGEFGKSNVRVMPTRRLALKERTKTMSQKYAKLKSLLKELFQLDRPDLDFGLYRIMHAKYITAE